MELRVSSMFHLMKNETILAADLSTKTTRLV